MNDEQEDESQEPESTKITFPLQAGEMPARILERCISIEATLATMLGIQVEILAHLKGSDPEQEIKHWVNILGKHANEIAGQVRSSSVNNGLEDEG